MEKYYKIKILIDGTTNKSIRSNLQIHFYQKDKQYIAKYDENTGLYFLDVTEEEEEGNLIVIDNGIEVYNNKIKPNEVNTYFHLQLRKENEQIFKSEIGTIYLCEHDNIGIVFDPNLKPLIEKELLLLGYQLHLKENRINNAFLKHFQDKNKQSWKEIFLIKKIKGITHAGFTSCDENGNTFNLFEGEIYIQLSNNTTIKSLKRDVDSLHLEHVSFDITDGIWHVITTEKTPYSLIELTHLLLQLNEVVNVWPVIYNEKILDEIVPNDFLWEGQWEKKLVHTQYAWQLLDNNGFHMFGNPELTMAIVDTGIASVLGVPENEDFQGNVSNGETKIAWLFDFRPASFGPNNNTPEGSHGVGVAGMAAAKANDVSPNPFIGQGVVGSAPNIRLTGVQFNGYNSTPTFLDTLTRYRWMAGLVNYVGQTPHPNDPLKLNKGVDIIVSSIGSRMYGTPTVSGINRFSKMLNDLKHYGRQGRGILMFYSAGNDDKNSDPPVAGNSEVRYSSFDQVFACAASTINHSGNEDRARYSNYSNSNLHPEKKLIDFCAPSGSISESDVVQSKRDNIHNPPNTFLTWTTDKVGEGNLPGYNDTSLTTELTSAISAYEYNDLLGEDLEPQAIVSGNIINPVSFGSSSFEVNNASVFTNYKWIKIETSSTTEWVIISSVDVPNNIINLASPITNNYLAGQSVSGYPYVSVPDSSGFFEGQYISIQSTPSEDKDIVQIQHIDPINSELVTSEISHPHSVLTFTGYGVFGLISVNVLTTNNLVEGKSILIGEVGYDDVQKKEKSDYEPVQKIINSTQFLVDRIRNSHSPGTKVYVGNLNYRNTFSGTSSAAPLCGGIGALVLSANPDLTWHEVHYILRKTAVKIDPDNIGFTVAGPPGNQDGVTGELGLGRWMDENGEYVLKIDGTPNPLSTGNRIYSDWYGYGRLNAEDAVQLALNYDESWLDLMIRDTLADEGTTDNVGTVHSPDIWIQHTEVDYTNTSSNPKPDFSIAPPHENPKTDSDRYIYARVKNKGELLNNLKCTVRFYIALCDGTNATGINSPFLFPDDWSGNTEVSTITSNAGTKQTYFVGEVEIAPDKIAPGGGDDFYNNDDSNRIVSVKWNEVDIPPSSTNLKTYLLVQVSPHDGSRNGLGAESNSNLSFREIVFADFQFKKLDGGSLPNEIEVDELGTETSDFEVEVKTPIGNFITEDVEIIIERHNASGVVDNATFKYNSTNSTWELKDGDGATPSWSTMSAPVEIGTSDPASGVQTEIKFSGSYSVDKQFSKVRIKAVINSSSPTNLIDIHVSEGIHDVAVYEAALNPGGLISSPGQPPLYPQSYTFTDFSSLTTQPANLAFGPSTGSETTKFRVTSSFTASSDVNAYAMVTGFAMIQPGAAADKVNLILRPFTQPISGFSKVKYIVYRGLRLDEFINASDPTKVAAENSSSNSEWLTELYATHHDLNPGEDFLSKALGYDPSNQSGSDLIDDHFFSTDDDFQLPFIARGTQLGKFFANGGSSDFGIDIILEDRKFTPDLDYARTAFHEIDITGLPSGTDAEKFTKRLKQDEILNFMDLAAFYGIHHTEEGKVRRRDGSNNTETIPLASLYSDVIDKFATRNAVYIDIRNELGDSLNFFTNYNDGSGNQVQFGTESGVLTPMGYHEHGWPILIRDNASAPFNTTSDFNEAFLQLRVDDNLSPMLFVKHGDLSTTAVKNKFVEGDDLISGTNPWTNEVGFTYPNTGPNGAKLNVSWFLKLNYSRQIDSNTVYPNTVVQTNYYTDNLFGDVDAVQPWDSSDATQWTVLQPDQYVDGSQAGFGQVSEKGIAIDKAQSTDRVILYANLTDDFASLEEFTPNSGQTSGTNKQESFLTEPMLFKGYNLEFDIINSSPNVTTMRFKQNPDNPVLEQNTQLLGLSKNQLDSLKLLSGFDNRYPRTIVFDKLGDFTDVNGKPYSKFKLGLHGLDSSGQYLKQFPASDIEIYSLDELFFTSTAFADLEPIPISYKLDVEEANGAKIKHAAKTLTIDSVDTGNRYFHVVGKDSGNLSENEKITVSGSAGNNGTYTVDEATHTGTKTTTIKVKEAIPSATGPFGQVSYPELTWQDYFIAFDQSTTIVSPPDKMATIAANFISAVNAVPNNETAPGLLETAINTYAPMILNRARAIVKENFSTNTPNPDDRILYWARLKMAVAIKSHPYIQKSAIDRNKLIDKFENLSRGYSAVNFSGAGSSTKKILITGFDPFDVFVNDPSSNAVQNNPSGAAALYLHDIDPGILGANAKIQTVIFPVRYRDFDGGVIERFFDQYFRDNSVDMVITLSQGVELRYDLERFASKYREPRLSDNENRRGKKPTFFVPDGASLKICDDPKSLPEFLETTLPTDSMVSTNPSDYGLQQGDEIFNQAWSVNPNKQSAPKRSLSNPGDTNLPNLPAPPADTVIKEGSGGNFLSNEIFYRVSLLRTEMSSIVRSGHLHLPLITQPTDIKRVENRDLINDVVNMVVSGINGI